MGLFRTYYGAGSKPALKFELKNPGLKVRVSPIMTKQKSEIFQELHDLQDEEARLRPLLTRLLSVSNPEEKNRILLSLPEVQENLSSLPDRCDPAFKSLLLSLAAIKQLSKLFPERPPSKKEMEECLNDLLPVEKLYEPIGGIIGYHYHFIKLILEKGSSNHTPSAGMQRPPGIHLDEDPETTVKAVREGVERLHEMAEIYPVAGAADRLNLHDEASGEPLPAAALVFQGHTLLEWLIRDLQAREYLHYKLSGKRLFVPVVFMTSVEKNNHSHILSICNHLGWFGRAKELFYFITQPLVPMIDERGQWVVKNSGRAEMKPGGHGIIWKLAENEKAFSWLKKRNKHHLLIRQINNPAAGLDMALLALSGIGCSERKQFGFVSCERIVHSSEGMDILIEEKTPDGFSYKITNVEYTDFDQRGIQDIPKEPGSPYSLFPTNTNILFASLRTIQKAIQKLPFPGLLINLKNTSTKQSHDGSQASLASGRLEAIMQNIADAIIFTSTKQLDDEGKKKLPSFVIYNKRSKTIAAAKKCYKPGQPILETPEGAFFTLLSEHKALLDLCGMATPELGTEENYLAKGPAFLFRYHPALGPLYSVIAQKISKGRIGEKSELVLELAELRMQNLDLKGSLIIEADNPLGHQNASGETLYSHRGGKCTLINVKVENQGVDYSIQQEFAASNLSRKESLEILIEGNGEFYAENIHFKGSYTLFIPKECKMTAVQDGENVKFLIEKIRRPSWHWSYIFGKDDKIRLRVDNLMAGN